MKRVLMLTAVLSVLTVVLFGQTAPVPDFKNSPMAIGKDGALIKLEKQNPEIKHKSKGMGYGGTSSFLNLTDKTSPVKLKSDAQFMIKVDQGVDPETIFYLTPAKQVGKTREVEMARSSAFAAYGAKGKSVNKDEVKLDFQKISDGVYKITTPGLKPGEYVFIATQQGASGAHSTVFCFTVE